jgi:hypothetical protein
MKPYAAVETRFIPIKARVTKKIDFLGEMRFGHGISLKPY